MLATSTLEKIAFPSLSSTLRLCIDLYVKTIILTALFNIIKRPDLFLKLVINIEIVFFVIIIVSDMI